MKELYRRVVTDNSIWIFDTAAQRYLRLPRNEAPPADAQIAYHGEWEDYTDIEELDYGDFHKLVVLRPVKWGSGAMRVTGRVLEDSHALEEGGCDLGEDA